MFQSSTVFNSPGSTSTDYHADLKCRSPLNGASLSNLNQYNIIRIFCWNIADLRLSLLNFVSVKESCFSSGTTQQVSPCTGDNGFPSLPKKKKKRTRASCAVTTNSHNVSGICLRKTRYRLEFCFAFLRRWRSGHQVDADDLRVSWMCSFPRSEKQVLSLCAGSVPNLEACKRIIPMHTESLTRPSFPNGKQILAKRRQQTDYLAYTQSLEAELERNPKNVSTCEVSTRETF